MWTNTHVSHTYFAFVGLAMPSHLLFWMPREQYWVTQTTSAQKREARVLCLQNFPVRVCKEKTKIPENGLAGFKDDFRISRISELLGKSRDVVRARWDLPESESDEGACGNIAEAREPLDGIKKCEVCKFFSKESNASLYCVECTKYLCESCSDKHLKTPIAKRHKVVNSSEAIDTQTNCKQHASETLKYFCRTCKIPLCIACTFTDEHQEHDVVELVEESGDNKERTQRNHYVM